MTHSIALLGCTPEPLMSYLKALGVLRLVSEQKDPDARAWWSGDVLQLQSAIDNEGLIAFFLNEYVPTPIVAPWSGGSGFFQKDNKRSVDALFKCGELRCRPYAEVIRLVRNILADEKVTEKPSDDLKARLLRRYRSQLPEPLTDWMDAAMVLERDGAVFAPLLGTGGNDGRLDFTQNFMARLVTLGISGGGQHPSSRAWLQSALFGATIEGLEEAAVGQFAPGRAGGPNATQGMEGSAIDNPWEFVLMLEGSLVLAGAAVRRLVAGENSRSSFPFTVRPVGAAYGSASENDEAQSRGEIWLPLWDRPAKFAEVRTVFAEGRATVSGRPARTAVDFARAVASLGVDRGLSSFSRYNFLKRSGKAYLASSLGRFQVREQKEVYLLRQIDRWLDAFRQAATSNDAPAQFHAARQRIDEAVFDVCRYGSSHMIGILRALGNAERHLATSERWRNVKRIQPLSNLSTEWISTTNDHSIEFEVALAIAGIYDREKKIGSLRSNLEPVENRGAYSVWTERNRCTVWRASDLASNMAAVLERRMIDGERKGCRNLPLDSRTGVSLHSVAAFLMGGREIDETKVAELVWGLMLVDHTKPYPETHFAATETVPLPRTYALLKLLFWPAPLVIEGGDWNKCTVRFPRDDEKGVRVNPEQRVLALLQAGRVPEVCEIAARRLRASRLSPMRVRWIDAHGASGLRLAAALLIPVAKSNLGELLNLVIRPESITEDDCDLKTIRRSRS